MLSVKRHEIDLRVLAALLLLSVVACSRRPSESDARHALRSMCPGLKTVSVSQPSDEVAVRDFAVTLEAPLGGRTDLTLTWFVDSREWRIFACS
jgi:hypothetical protein